MKKTMLAVLAFFFCGPCIAVMASETYCEELNDVGLKGKDVTVIPDVLSERNFVRGVVVSVSQRTLVVQTSGSRAYVNCAHIHSVFVAEEKEKKISWGGQ